MSRETSSPAPRIGLLTCVALVVGNSIGGGVYLLPASLAPYGINGLIAWVTAAAGASLLAVMYVKLSRALPRAGGPYAYTREAFGPLPAFLVSWGYWISIWVGNAAIVVGGVSYLGALYPAIDHRPGAAPLLAIAVLWSLTIVNCRGIAASGRVQAVSVVLKVLPLIAVAIAAPFALREGQFGDLRAATPASFDAVTTAATMTLFALIGLESATIPADKVRDPQRTVPAATLIGALATILICALACTAVLLILPSAELARSSAPFVDLSVRLWGAWSGPLVAGLAAVSAFGALNGWILLQGELPYAMAKAGAFPAFFARTSRRGAPVGALVFGSVLVTALLLTNFRQSMVSVFTFMILLSTTACVLMYGVCALALVRLSWNGRIRTASGNARAGLVALGGAAALYSLWAMIGAGREANLWGLALLAAGLPFYYGIRKPSAP
ncbi:MAG: amino acid permease [Gammaproteobacteria bacterium]|nr:amino acid permease [Gammaproteobacteria bacterium]